MSNLHLKQLEKANFFQKVKHIHFIGISGISMSGLAKYTNIMYPFIKITGNTNIENYKIENIIINGHTEIFLNNIDVCVYSSSIDNNNSEFQLVKSNPNILILKRVEYLNILTSDKPRISIVGCHGKTSITAYTHQLMQSVDPTTFIGAGLENNETFAIGSGCYITENDESEKGFLNLYSEYNIIPNIGDDHLENYNNSLNEYWNTFRTYLKKCESKSKYIIYNKNCSSIQNANEIILHNMIQESRLKNISYGYEDCDINIQPIHYEKHLQWKLNTKMPQLISLNNRTFSVSNIIGIWNIYNITASMVVATLFNIPLEDNIKLYKPKRRLEVIYDKSDTLILDDYAVHPTEITAVVGACLQLYKEDNLYVIWQPHRLSRLKRLHERFKESFSLLKKENLFIFPIYEVNITSYTEEEWMELIDYGKFIKDRDLPTLIRQLEGKVILLLTAGDLNYKVKSIINDL